MRILIAEDDSILADGIARSLHRSGHSVDWAADGQAATQLIEAGGIDLLILDLDLPKVSGTEVLRRIHARQTQLPVLVISALDRADDRVRRLDLTLDDYLPKPFDLDELEARIRKLARRRSALPPQSVEFGPLSCDLAGGVARLDGDVIELPPRERSLLELLVERAEKLVGNEELAQRLSGADAGIGHNALETYMDRLRKRLENCRLRIVTVRGLGYCLVASEPSAGAHAAAHALR